MSRYRTEIGLAIACLVVLGLTELKSGIYTSPSAFGSGQEVLRKAAILGLFALGAGTVIISGGIDLSAGSVIAFAATVFASTCLLIASIGAENGPDTTDLSWMTLGWATLATLMVALAIGAFHAWLITAVNLPPFVATLATLVGLRSIARLLIQRVDMFARGSTSGTTKIYLYDSGFASWGSDYRVPLVTFAVFAAGLWTLLRLTVAGRHIYAVGGNETAARLSGIRVVRVKWLVYTISSVTAAAAGILYCSYIGAATPETQGLGYELNAIAAAVVGGCGLAGGTGGVVGIALGALFLTLVIDLVAKLAPGLSGSQSQLEGSVVGLLVILAVALNELWGRSSQTRLFAGPLGLVAIGLLTVLGGLVVSLFSESDPLRNGLVAASATMAICIARAVQERRWDRSPSR